MLMVQAGPGTDATIKALLPHLDKGRYPDWWWEYFLQGYYSP